MQMLEEARRLYGLGLGVHWIKPNSKAPLKPGWSKPERDDWDTLKKDYNECLGLGVRMGEASNLGDGFLANIDVDIKSADPRHKKEALEVITRRFPGLINKAPVVKTSYGYRLFIKTKKPVQSGKISSSNEDTVVFMPTSEITKQQLKAVEEGKITQAELDKGYRIRKAWEVELMSVGKQVVLPPSIHPDTKKPYIWQRPLKDPKDIPLVTPWLDLLDENLKPDASIKSEKLYDFKPVEVDLFSSKLSSKMIDTIVSGAGVEDRSAAMFGATLAMLKAGFDDSEILSVLTNDEYVLGEVAYDHRKTRSRQAAAMWVNDYCLRKAKSEVDAKKIFEAELIVTPTFETEAEVKSQLDELISEDSWEYMLDCTGKEGNGPPKCNVKNVMLILTRRVCPDVIKRDVFSDRDFYSVNTPWGGRKGNVISDICLISIKVWLSHQYGFEPNVGIINEAVVELASKNSFHPIKKEFESLPEWDGIGRINTWLRDNFNAEEDDEYLAQVFRKWLVAGVKRIYEPGAKFDWLPIFEGMQGTGKSSFGAILFGPQYFADWLPRLDDKDAALGLSGLRCVEFGELDQLRRNEVETIKAFVSRQVDKVRPPYGSKRIEMARQCVFFGTTNSEYYLKDSTGNRRFNPIKVGKLDFGALRRDRDQLWAEALFIYNNDLEPNLELEGETVEYAKETQADKVVLTEADMMAESLLEFIEAERLKPEADRFNLARFKLTDLFKTMGPLSRFKEDAKHIQLAANALKLIKAVKIKAHRGERFWCIK